MRRVTFGDVDSTDEIAKQFNILIDNVNLVETKVCQLEGNKAEKSWVQKLFSKKDKKGSASMKTLLMLCIIAIATAVAFGAWDINYDNCSNPENLVNLLTDRFANQTANSYTFTPTTSTPTAAEGKVYYNNTGNVLQLYNGAAWVNIDTAGGVTLDGAYDSGGAGIGRSITVDSGAVTFTSTDAANNVVFTVAQGDTATAKAITITNAGTGNSIDIQGQASAKDIEGTGDTWNVSTAGVGTFVGLSVGNSDIVFTEPAATDITIRADTDGEIEFAGTAVEDFSIGLATSNQIDFSSDSGAVTIEFNTLDTLQGMQTITGGNSGDFTIQTTSDTAGEDLIISQAGSGAYSVIIQSAGTGTDSISIQATKGIDIDSVDDMAITNTASTAGDDFTIAQTGSFDASLLITSAGTGLDAISLTTSDIDGDIVINSGDKLNIDAADDIEIDLAGAAGEDILITNTGGSIVLSATEDIEDAITLSASTGGINITADGAAASDLDLVCTNGSVNISGGEAITTAVVISAGTAGGGIDITSNEDIDITTTGAEGEDISIINTGGSIIITASEAVGDAIVIQSTNAAGGIDIISGTGDLALVSTDDITLTTNTAVTDAITITNTLGTDNAAIAVTATAGGVDIDGAAAKSVNIAGGSVALVSKTTGAGAISLTTNIGAAETITITNSAGTGTDAINVDSTLGGIDFDCINDFAITVASGAVAGTDILLTQTGAVDSSIILTAAGTGTDAIQLSATAGTVDIQGDIMAIDTTADMTLTVTSSTDGEDLLLIQSGTNNSSITLTAAGNGADAIGLQAAAGGIDIDGGAGGDIAITSTSKSIVLTATEAVGDAIVLTASNAAGGIDILAGTGDIQISCTDAINIAQDSVAQLVTIGNETGASSLNLKAGTGNIDIQGVAATTITIGDAAQTAAITIGASTATMTNLSLGTGVGAHTIHIGDGGTAAQLVTIGSTSAASAVTIQAGTGKVTMSSAGTGADAFNIDTSAGGIDIDIVGAADGEDFAVDAVSSIQLTSSQAVGDAIKLNASDAAGGITVAYGTGNMSITGTGVSADFSIDCDLLSIDATGASNISFANAAGEDVTIATTGAADHSLIITASGTGDDALQITSSAGGIDITNGGGGGGTEDLNITSTNAAVYISGGEATADAVKITASNAAGGIDIDAGSGGIIGLATAGAVTLTGQAASTLTVTSGTDAEDLTLSVTGSGDSSVLITSIGTGADAISLTVSGTGGDLAMVVNDSLTATADNVLFTTDEAASNQFKVDATGAAAGNVIVLETTDGGVLVDADGAVNGDITLDAQDVISLTAGNAAGILASTNAKTLRYQTHPLSYISATEVRVGNGGNGALCVSLDAGVDEIGATTGYVAVGDAADYLRFWIPLPATFVDTGVQANLVLQFYISEQAVEECNIDVRLFEFNNTTPILTDTLVVANGAAAAWVNLVTNATGIGNDTDIDVDDGGYFVEVTATADADDFRIFGVRWLYRVGLQATQ